MIRFGLIVSLVFLAAMAAFSAYGFLAIPADALLPSHWNIRGEVDAYQPRNVMLLAVPAMALGLSAVFAVVPLIDPRKDNVRKSGGLYLAGWIGALALVALLHGAIVVSAAQGLDTTRLMPRVILFGVAALLVLLGNFTAKSRSSFFLGVRTPWTLSSEHAWIVTNRAAGWMLVLTGLLAAGAGLLADMRIAFYVLLGGVLATVVMSVAISYFAWASDPERQG